MHGRIANRNRVLAGLIDIGVIAVILIVAAFAPSVIHRKPVVGFTAAFVGVVLCELYSLLDAYSTAGTAGKRILRLRIARADGRHPTDGSLIARWFLKFIPLHVLALELVWLAIKEGLEPRDASLASTVRLLLLLPDFVATASLASHLVMFDDLRQSIHDILTNTAVFDASVNDPTTGFNVLLSPADDATPGRTPDPPTADTGRSDPLPSGSRATPRTC
jgi:uncharacterized RDD family membrane protein YckC